MKCALKFDENLKQKCHKRSFSTTMKMLQKSDESLKCLFHKKSQLVLLVKNSHD